MPSLRDLVDNLNNFSYYSGVGTFDANNRSFGDKKPYIVTKPGFRWSPGNFNDGIVGTAGLIGTATHTAADVLRIGKFFTDAPKGPLFLLKQTGLQLMNPQLESRNDRPFNVPESGQGIFRNTLNAAINVGNRISNEIGVTRIYNPLGTNTLAQVGVSALGLHVPRHGLLPYMNEQDKYINVVKQKDENGANRLVGLSSKFANPAFEKNGGVVIAEYTGGPQSALGIGTTTIKSAGYLTTLIGNATGNTSPNGSGLNGFIPLGVNILQSIDSQGRYSTSRQIPTIESDVTATQVDTFNFRGSDFRTIKNRINKDSSVAKLPESDYMRFNMHKRIGTINRNGINSWQKNPNDKLNMVSIYYGDRPFGTNYTDVNGIKIDSSNVIRDLIKFRIKILDNDKPSNGTYIIFRAFFDGDIYKDIVAKWTPYTYVGRGEQFYTYESTTSVLSFSFTIVAFSKAEMKSLYQKLNYFESSMYPDYKANKMRGNIAELTIGDYIKYQPGIFNTLNIGIPQDANWEIAMDEPENGTDKDMHELPQMLKISCTFTPIYNFLPRRNSQTPFMGIDDVESNTKGTPKDWLSVAVEPKIDNKKK